MAQEPGYKDKKLTSKLFICEFEQLRWLKHRGLRKIEFKNLGGYRNEQYYRQHEKFNYRAGSSY